MSRRTEQQSSRFAVHRPAQRQNGGYRAVSLAPMRTHGAHWLIVMALVAALVLVLSLALPAAAARAAAVAGVSAARASGELVPRFQDQAPDTGTDSETESASDPFQMATMVAVVSQQRTESVTSLSRVADVAVTNPLETPVPTVDPGIELTATAAAIATESAAATQTAVAEAAAESARATQAAEATQTAEAAQARTAASATRTASAAATQAAIAATTETEAPANDPGRDGNATIAGKVADMDSFLLIALAPGFGGLVGYTVWRGRGEPFVLKAKSTPS